MIMVCLYFVFLRFDVIDCCFFLMVVDVLYKVIILYCIWRSDEGYVRVLYWVERSWGIYVEIK